MHICTKEPQKVLEQRQREVATTFALVTSPPPCSPPPIPVLVGGRAQYAWWQPPLPHLTLTHCHTGAYTIIAAAHTTTTLPQTYTTTMLVVHNNTEQWWHTHHNGPPTLLILWPLRQIFHLVIIVPHIIILSYSIFCFVFPTIWCRPSTFIFHFHSAFIQRVRRYNWNFVVAGVLALEGC